MLAERVVEWTQEWKQAGFEKGFLQGFQQGFRQGFEIGFQQRLAQGREKILAVVRATLLTILEERFGALPDEVRQRVGSLGSVEELADLLFRSRTDPSLASLGLARD
jgi:flagellar biosynthesis/type III secretory pathway protein FliH